MVIEYSKYSDEKDLIKLINNSDAKAFEIIFKEYYKSLCNYLLFFIKESDIIEQLVQDLFVNIWENRTKFTPKGSVKSYLFRAVKNKAINYLKHENVKQRTEEKLKLFILDNEKGTDKYYEEKELQKIIETGINSLPERCKEIFILIKYQELSYKETAEILDLSTKTVETQMGRALKKLREYLLPILE